MIIYLYLILIPLTLLNLGCSHQVKQIQEKPQKAIPKKVLQTITDIKPGQIAFTECNIVYFNKLNNEDFKFLKKERAFDLYWEKFLKNAVDDKLIIKLDCHKVLEVFHKNKISYFNPYAIHFVLSENSESLVESFIKLDLFPAIVLKATIQQLQYLKLRNESVLDFKASEFDLNSSIVDFFLKRVTSTNKIKSSVLESQLELFSLGEIYNFCSFKDKSIIYNADKITPSVLELVSCNNFSYSDKGANLLYAKVLEFDKEWLKLEPQDLELKNESDRPSFLYNGTAVIKRADVISPFVLSDGILMVPIPKNAFKKIFIDQNNFYLQDESAFSCDISYDNQDITIEVIKDDSVDKSEFKKYPLPVGFNLKNAVLIQNIDLKNSGECGC